MAICHGLTRFIYDADNIRIVLQSGHCTYPDSNNGARGLHKLYAKLFLSYKVNTKYHQCYQNIHRRRKVHDYFLLLLCKSSIWFTEKQIFKIIIYFFNTSKCVANYVILFFHAYGHFPARNGSKSTITAQKSDKIQHLPHGTIQISCFLHPLLPILPQRAVHHHNLKMKKKLDKPYFHFLFKNLRKGGFIVCINPTFFLVNHFFRTRKKI